MKTPEESTLDRDLSGTYLFISFDLVNSTAFKSIDPQWPPLFSGFFDYCQIITRNYFPKSQTWKMIGDEILFYLPIEDRSELLEAPSKVFALLEKSIAYIENERSSDNLLSVKSTIWATEVKELRYSNEKQSDTNYLLKSHNGGVLALDFLGPHIDTGFRIGSFAHHGKVTIGAQLAHYICSESTTEEQKRELNNLRIVSLEQLRGVWGGRHYPIVWYHKEWENQDALFYYDEQITSPLVHRIFKNDICKTPNIERIHKIFSDLTLESSTSVLNRGIETYHENNWGKEISLSIPSERLSELHLVAFCFNEKNELLIGLNEKESIWDFGLGYLMKSKSIEESLITAYKSDFGVELEEINSEFPPVATYSVVTDNWEQRTIPGIMCLADISNQSLSVDPFRYKKSLFISEGDAGKIAPTDAVEGFHERITMAFEALRKAKKQCE